MRAIVQGMLKETSKTGKNYAHQLQQDIEFFLELEEVYLDDNVCYDKGRKSWR